MCGIPGGGVKQSLRRSEGWELLAAASSSHRIQILLRSFLNILPHMCIEWKKILDVVDMKQKYEKLERIHN